MQTKAIRSPLFVVATVLAGAGIAGIIAAVMA